MGHASHRMTRRGFLYRTGLATGCTALLSGTRRGLALEPDQHRVAIAQSERVMGDGGLNAEVLGELIDRAVMWVTGESTPEAAWASRFSSDEVVGIKPNGIAGYEMSTSRELIEHCVERLAGIGVKRSNIIIWEQTGNHLDACGVPPSEVPWGVRAVVTGDSLGPRVHHGSFVDQLTTVITDEADAILNLPILKDHSGAGVTLAMKNHYGSIGNPGAQHADGCNPQIVDLSDLPPIRDKTRLIVCDMTHCLVDGGPFGAPHYFPNAVMVGVNVVAHDAVGWRIIEDERARRNLPTLEAVGRKPRYIEMAAERGLGVADLSQLSVNVMEV